MIKPSAYLERVTKELAGLPGIGSRSASRIAFHLLRMNGGELDSLIGSIRDLKENIFTCSICGGISDSDVCTICSDTARDRGLLCVVEEARDLLSIEATGGFDGLYHVLSGLISPLDGVGPDELNIDSLIRRCGEDGFREVILALNPTIEGDATVLYLAGIIAPMGVELTRIAHGLPVGADLEYVDSATITKSIQGRVRV